MKAVRGFLLACATGFGLGFSPLAPGTAGSLPGVVLAWFLWQMVRLPAFQLLLALVLTLSAIPLCSFAESVYRTKDDRRIVADEYLTFPLSVIGLPIIEHPVLLAVAFVTCRGFDILKPWPAYRLQRLPRGLGIVADDFFSSLYSLALNHLIWYWLSSLRMPF